MSIDFLPQEIRDKYEIHEWKHACAVLKGDFLVEWEDIIEVLKVFKLKKSEILAPGGGLSLISQWFNQAFLNKGWQGKALALKQKQLR